jgi:hypothetical protein
MLKIVYRKQGRIQDFKLGGAHLKKLRRAQGGAKMFGVFRVKNHDFTPKIIFFPILGEGGAITEILLFGVKHHNPNTKLGKLSFLYLAGEMINTTAFKR